MCDFVHSKLWDFFWVLVFTQLDSNRYFFTNNRWNRCSPMFNDVHRCSSHRCCCRPMHDNWPILIADSVIIQHHSIQNQNIYITSILNVYFSNIAATHIKLYYLLSVMRSITCMILLVFRHFLNPYSIAICLGKSTAVINNLFIFLSFMYMLKGE